MATRWPPFGASVNVDVPSEVSTDQESVADMRSTSAGEPPFVRWNTIDVTKSQASKALPTLCHFTQLCMDSIGGI